MGTRADNAQNTGMVVEISGRPRLGWAIRKRAGESIRRRGQGGAEVVPWKLTGAGHRWPGAKPNLERLPGPATRAFITSCPFRDGSHLLISITPNVPVLRVECDNFFLEGEPSCTD